MKQGFRCIDSDLHVIEGGEVFGRYLDEGYRGRIEYMGLAPTNFPWWKVEGRPIPPWAVSEEVAGPQRYLDAPTEAIYGELRQRGFEARDALWAMDQEGLDLAEEKAAQSALTGAPLKGFQLSVTGKNPRLHIVLQGRRLVFSFIAGRMDGRLKTILRGLQETEE